MKNTHIVKQSLVLLLAVTLTFLLCACSSKVANPGTPSASAPVSGNPSAQISNTPTSTPTSPSASAASPEASSVTSSQAPSSPANPSSNEPPITQVAANAAVPDFLNNEQVDLYRRALSMFFIFHGAPDGIDSAFPLPTGLTQASPPSGSAATENGIQYYAVTGRYQMWNDFQAMCLGLFTQEYFDALNKAPSFKDIGGYTYYADISMGGAFGYAPENSPDTFELVSKTDTSISFNLIGHYYENGVAASAGTGPVTTQTFPITMVLTADGWRFSQFNVAG